MDNINNNNNNNYKSNKNNKESIITKVNEISNSKQYDPDEKFQIISDLVKKADENYKKIYNEKLKDEGVRAQGRKSILELDTELKEQQLKLNSVKKEYKRIKELVETKGFYRD